MSEKLTGGFEQKSDLEEVAYDARLRKDVVLPKEGTGAYESLEKTCKAYSSAVAQEMIAHSMKFFETSGKTRRALHAELCINCMGRLGRKPPKTILMPLGGLRATLQGARHLPRMILVEVISTPPYLRRTGTSCPRP